MMVITRHSVRRGVATELDESMSRRSCRRRVARDEAKELLVAVRGVRDGAPFRTRSGENAHAVREFVQGDGGARVRVREFVEKGVEFHHATPARREGGANGVEETRETAVQSSTLAISHRGWIVVRLDFGLTFEHGLHGARGETVAFGT